MKRNYCELSNSDEIKTEKKNAKIQIVILKQTNNQLNKTIQKKKRIFIVMFQL